MITTLDKVPPQAIDVEEAVLGALMLEKDAYHTVQAILKPESFYKEEHKKIFNVIKELASKEKPIDLLVVTQELKNRGELDEVGGPLYITQLTSRVASAAHIEFHARIIAQKFIQRELIRIGSELITASFDDNEDIETILSNLKLNISEAEGYSYNSNSGGLQADVCKAAIIEIEKDCQTVKAGKSPGITTGFRDLDYSTGGWRNTNLIVLAARPGVGKTSLALHFAIKAARAGNWVNYYSMEMKKEDLFRIILSGESGVNRSDIRDGTLKDSDWIPINNAVTSLENLPIIWFDYAGITPAQIKANTAKNRKKGKCDIIILDYLQLIAPTDRKAIREQQISEMSRTFKGIALNENIPFICLSQLNREASETKPQLHHLRESGAIEQDADIVLFPHRDKEDNSFIITVAKNRRGRIGDFKILANDEMTVFENMPREIYKKQNTSINATAVNPNRNYEPNDHPF
ncbi:MAG: replicative DNA helicase [Bacteroidetes bacterium]|nr:replicative DNA helicase [Bacteroidota bacterium]